VIQAFVPASTPPRRDVSKDNSQRSKVTAPESPFCVRFASGGSAIDVLHIPEPWLLAAGFRHAPGCKNVDDARISILATDKGCLHDCNTRLDEPPTEVDILEAPALKGAGESESKAK
jgi:hypothetical protein